MYPIILERDTKIIDWTGYEVWATTFTLATSSTIRVKSDGLLHVDFGTVKVRGNTPVITARSVSAVGVHITGPVPGVDYTCYSISASCMCADPEVKPFLFIGESPVTITSDAGGDVVTSHRLLGVASLSGAEGSSLEKELTVAVKENTTDLALCFGVGILASASTSAALTAYTHLSVRRLIGNAPPIIDTRKL